MNGHLKRVLILLLIFTFVFQMAGVTSLSRVQAYADTETAETVDVPEADEAEEMTTEEIDTGSPGEIETDGDNPPDATEQPADPEAASEETAEAPEEARADNEAAAEAPAEDAELPVVEETVEVKAEAKAAASHEGHTVLAFTSDVHNQSNNKAANRMDTWINKVESIHGKIDVYAFGGDMADAGSSGTTFFEYTQADMNVIDNHNITGVYTTGNHEYNSSKTYGVVNNATTAQYKINAEAYSNSNCRIYCLGSVSGSSSYSTQTSSLNEYLNGTGNDKPIFIITHFPLHYYGGRTTTGAADVIDLLNAAVENGTPNDESDDRKIVFLWGHNHTMSDTYYDYIYKPGDSIPTSSSSSSAKTIKFYYGGAGCMSDSDYGTGSGFVKGKGLIVDINSKNQLSFTYYNADGTDVTEGGTYTEQDPIPATGVTIDEPEPGDDGQVAGYSVAAGKSLQLSVTFEPADANTNKTINWTSADSTIATVDSDGKVKGVSEGTTTITATLANTNTKATVSSSVEVTVGPRGAEPVYELTDTLVPGKNYIITSGNSGTVHALTNSNGSVASTDVEVDGNTITTDNADIVFTAEGSDTSTTDLENNGRYLAVSRSGSYYNYTYSISLETVARNIAWTYSNEKYLSSYRNSTSTSSIYVYYSSSNGFSASDTTSGTSSRAVYLFVEQESSEPIAVTGVTIDPETASVKVGKTATLAATVSPANATNKNVTWSSCNTAVATVDSAGKVTGVAAGTATITATTEDGGFTDTCAITVIESHIEKYVLVNELEANSEYVIMSANSGTGYALKNNGASSEGTDMGASSALTITKGDIDNNGSEDTYIENDSDDIVWTTGNEVSIHTDSYGDFGVGFDLSNTSPGGYLEGKSGGVKIYSELQYTTTTDRRGWKYNEDQQLQHVGGRNTYTVYYSNGFTTTYDTNTNKVYLFKKYVPGTDPVSGVTVSPTTLGLGKGSSATLTATVQPSSAANKNVSWSTSDANIATVDNTGKVTGVAEGEATITVTTEDGGYTASCEVTVTKQKTYVITVGGYALSTERSPNTAYGNGNSTSYNYTGLAGVEFASGDGAADNIRWIFEETTGGYYIKSLDGKYLNATYTSVTNPTEANPTKGDVKLDNTLDVWVLDSGYSLDSGTVDGSKLKSTNASAGSTSDKFLGYENDKNLFTIRSSSNADSVTISEASDPVTATDITVNPTEATILVGGETQLAATVTPDDATGTVTWTSSNDSIATVNNTGKVTGVAVGTATITATIDGLTATCNVTVNPVPVESVALNKTTADIMEGKTLQLTATVEPANATDKTVTWTSSNPEIASVDNTGKVTGEAAGGPVTITATAGGKSATCEVAVTEFVAPTGYVIAIDGFALSNVPSGDELVNSTSYHYHGLAGVEYTETVANDPPASILWTITETTGGVYIQDADGKYLRGVYDATTNPTGCNANLELSDTPDVWAIEGSIEDWMIDGSTLKSANANKSMTYENESGSTAINLFTVRSTGENSTLVDPEHPIATETRYIEVSSFTDNKNFIIAVTKDDGSVYALKNTSGTIGAETLDLTVEGGDTFITTSDTGVIWKYGVKNSSSTSKYLANDSSYLTVGNSSLSMGSTGSAVSYSSTKLQLGSRYLRYNSGFTTTSTNTNSGTDIRLFQEKKVITGPSINLDKQTMTVPLDGTSTLTATVKNAEGATVTWSSSDEAVATVNNGTVSGISAGTATITASITYEGETYSASCNVTVKEVITLTYDYVETAESGTQYVIVSNGYALVNNNGSVAAVPATVNGNTVTILADEYDEANMLWTVDEPANGTFKNGNYYVRRASGSNELALTLNTATETKYTNWSYDGSYINVMGGNSSNTEYVMYYNDGWKTYTKSNAPTNHQTKLYGVTTTPHTHEYGTPVYTWADDNSTCTATVTCSVCEEGAEGHSVSETANAEYAVTTAATCTAAGSGTYTASFTNGLFTTQTKDVEIPAAGHTMTLHAAVAPTCTEDGTVEYWSCSKCNKNFGDEAGTTELTNIVDSAIGHAYGAPTYVWAADNSTVTASRVCANNSSHVDTQTVTTTYAVTTPATCEAAGVGTYTATFTNNAFAKQTKNVAIEALGHDWEFVNFTWTGNDTDGYSAAVAYYKCKNNETHTQTVAATVTSATTAATCEQAGQTVYTATVTATASLDGAAKTDTKTVAIPALNHDWEFVDFTWTGNDTDGYTAAVANYKCKNNAAHTQTVTATVTPVTTAATCLQAGSTVYTATVAATVSLDGTAHSDEKTVTIAATGHKWGTPTWTWTGNDDDGYTKAVATFICENDESHKTEVTDDTIDVVTVPATPTEAGSITYTAIVTGPDNKSYSDQKVKTLTPTGYSFKDPVYSWTEVTGGGYSCTALKECNEDPAHNISETVTATYAVTIPATCETAGAGTYTATFTNTAFETQTKPVEIDALGHKLTAHAATLPTCTEAGNSAYWSCDRCDKFFSDAEGNTEIAENSWVIEATGHDLTAHAAVAATCETAGNSAYWTCDTCGKYFSDAEGKTATTAEAVVIAALGHDWNAPTYAWAADHTSVTATRTCKNNASHTETETVAATSAVTKEATCTESGVKTWTSAAFENEAFAVQTATEIIPAISHDWAEPTYEWATDHTSVTATRICKNDPAHVETETSTAIGTVTTPATCTQEGVKTWTSAEFTNPAFAVQRTTEIIPKTGHDWNNPTYDWAADHTSVTATRTCKNDPAHVETDTASARSEVTKAATCTEDGVKTWTSAAFSNTAFAVQTTTEVIPATGHIWIEPAEWTWIGDDENGYTKVEGTFTCQNDSTHTQTVESANITMNRVDPTPTQPGKITYSAKITGPDNVVYSIKREIIIPAAGYTYKDPVYTWTETTDGYSVEALKKCNEDDAQNITETVTASYEVTKPATCEATGVGTYTASFTNSAFATQTKPVDIPALGHDWNDPTDKWNNDHTSVDMTFTCKNDPTHTHTETVNGSAITSEITTEPTATAPGVRTYTATVTLDGKTYTVTDTEVIPATGSTVSGSITSFVGRTEEGQVSVQLFVGDSTEAAYTATVNNNETYTFAGVAAGTYNLTVSKKDHVTRTYEITVNGTAVTQDVKIHLLGDVTGDGKLTTADVSRVNSHVRKIDLITDEYIIKCGDVIGSDGVLTTGDVSRINSHVRKLDYIW